MKMFFLLFTSVVFSQVGFSQHIQYREKPKPVQQTPAPIVTPPTVDTVKEIFTPNTECPGMDASLPVLMNYVPPEIVAKFKLKFNGHCYCITSIKVSETETQYKLRVCNKGEFVERFVDTEGVVVR